MQDIESRVGVRIRFFVGYSHKRSDRVEQELQAEMREVRAGLVVQSSVVGGLVGCSGLGCRNETGVQEEVGEGRCATAQAHTSVHVCAQPRCALLCPSGCLPTLSCAV